MKSLGRSTGFNGFNFVLREDKPVSLDTLYAMVSDAIRRAEILEETGSSDDAAEVYRQVSKLEETIAGRLPPTHVEGQIAWRGAVRSAILSCDFSRAIQLTNHLTANKEAGEELKDALLEMISPLKEEREKTCLKVGDFVIDDPCQTGPEPLLQRSVFVSQRQPEKRLVLNADFRSEVYFLYQTLGGRPSGVPIQCESPRVCLVFDTEGHCPIFPARARSLAAVIGLRLNTSQQSIVVHQAPFGLEGLLRHSENAEDFDLERITIVEPAFITRESSWESTALMSIQGGITFQATLGSFLTLLLSWLSKPRHLRELQGTHSLKFHYQDTSGRNTIFVEQEKTLDSIREKLSSIHLIG